MDRMHDELLKLNGNGLLCTVVMIFFMTENKITSFCSFCISHPFIIANPRDMLMDLPDFLYNVKYCSEKICSYVLQEDAISEQLLQSLSNFIWSTGMFLWWLPWIMNLPLCIAVSFFLLSSLVNWVIFWWMLNSNTLDHWNSRDSRAI